MKDRRPSFNELMAELKSMEKRENIEGMARYGIRPKARVYGAPMPRLREMARRAGRDHELAKQLWESEVYDAMVLACLVDDPKKVTEKQMEEWVKEFDTWSLCDGCCSNLFDRTEFAHKKAIEWSARKEEYVRRAGFVLMAALATHDKKADDAKFLKFLPVIARYSDDDRNFVKKAVNWALRGIGKRSSALNAAAIETAGKVALSGKPSARWIASDALRELKSEAVQTRLNRIDAKARR